MAARPDGRREAAAPYGDRRRPLNHRDRRPDALVPRPAAAALGAGRGRRHPGRHRRARRRPCRRAAGASRPGRDQGPGAGHDRQSPAADPAQGGRAARTVAAADLKRIEVGTRAEVIASRKAALAATEANAHLAEQTYDRTKQLTTRDFASVQKLDEATATLDVARRSREQARLSSRKPSPATPSRSAAWPRPPWSRRIPPSPP